MPDRHWNVLQEKPLLWVGLRNTGNLPKALSSVPHLAMVLVDTVSAVTSAFSLAPDTELSPSVYPYFVLIHGCSGTCTHYIPAPLQTSFRHGFMRSPMLMVSVHFRT